MDPIDDYLERLKRRLPRRDRNAILAEVKDHLESDTEARQDAESIGRNEAALAAIRAFGTPTEIAAGYDPDTGVIRSNKGDVLVRMAAATGRGIRGTAKFTLIAVGILLAFIAIIGIAALIFANENLDRFEDDIRENIPHDAYYRSESYATTDPQTGPEIDEFSTPENMKRLEVEWSVNPDGPGCLQLRLISPAGDTHELNGDGCAAGSGEASYFTPGDWSVQYAFVGFTGAFHVEADYYEHADP